MLKLTWAEIHTLVRSRVVLEILVYHHVRLANLQKISQDDKGRKFHLRRAEELTRELEKCSN